jgi:oxaloacetate decarboxylase alpha subunit
LSPVHTNEGFVTMFQELLEIGADSLCIKDMGGLIAPADAFDLVTRLKAMTSVPIALHSHYTSGMASMAYLKAAEAGVDIVDCAISSMSLGSSQPPTETLVAALQRTDRATGLDLGKLAEIGQYFAGVRKTLNRFEMGTHGVDTNVLQFQVPGGDDLQPRQPVARARAGGETPRGLAGDPPGAGRFGLSAPGDPVEPNLRHPGRPQCLDGRAIPDSARGGAQYRQRHVRADPGPDRPRFPRQSAGRRGPDRRAAGGSPEAGDGTGATADIGTLAGSEEDVLSYVLFPQIARTFLANRVKQSVQLSGAQAAAIAVALDGRL